MFIKMYKALRARLERDRLTKTKLSRNQLRHTPIMVDGKEVDVYEYINILITKLPEMQQKDGIILDHKIELRYYYFTYGLDGLHYYVRNVRRIIKTKQKAFKKHFKVLLNEEKRKIKISIMQP